MTRKAPAGTSFTSRTVPWMKLGTTIDDEDVGAAEAARLGGLDFEIALEPAGHRKASGAWRVTPNRFAITRLDTDEVFNYTTKDYELISYADAFEFLDGINPRYVAAGSFGGGRQGFIVARLPDRTAVDLKLGGETDHHDLYTVVRTSQNLSRGVEVAILMLRGRCMNELTLPSLTRDAPQSWSIRHTRNAREKLAEARSVLTRADRYVEDFQAQARRLVEVDLELEEAERLIRAALPDRPRREEQVGAIVDAWRTSPTVGFEGTGWGLVNATSEYFEWGRPMSRGRSVQSQFTGALDGATHKYVARVAQLALRSR